MLTEGKKRFRLKIAATAQNTKNDEKLHGATSHGEITTLLDEIGQGLRADDATNFEKLVIARKYGPLLWQLKAIVGHGHFKNCLKERFPKISYYKCNRWMVIAEHEQKVAEALATHPDVSWGPKKMVDFLRGSWSPQTDFEEEESSGHVAPDPHLIELDPDPELDGTGFLDDEPDAEPKHRWEQQAAKAEMEAGLTEAEPSTQSSAYAVTVTVFSNADVETMEAGLSKWQPKTKLLHASKQTNNVAVECPRDQIQKLLRDLGAMFSSCSRIRLVVES